MKILCLFCVIFLGFSNAHSEESNNILINCSKNKIKVDIIQSGNWNVYLTAKYQLNGKKFEILLQDSVVYNSSYPDGDINFSEQIKNAEFVLDVAKRWVVVAGFDERYPQNQISLIGEKFKLKNNVLYFTANFNGPGLTSTEQLECVFKKR